jgi:MFS family permease
VLRDPSFRWLWSAATVSNFGSMLHAVALPFVAITVLDASPADIALLAASGLLPGFALGLFASTWIDRWPRRSVLVAADVLRAVVVLWIPAAAWLDALTLGQL